MSADMLMLRGEQEGSFNLAVGEPVFLQESLSFAAHQSRRSTFATPHTVGTNGSLT
jgi:hypothetical protein